MLLNFVSNICCIELPIELPMELPIDLHTHACLDPHPLGPVTLLWPHASSITYGIGAASVPLLSSISRAATLRPSIMPPQWHMPVAYTHMTLPTLYAV